MHDVVPLELREYAVERARDLRLDADHLEPRPGRALAGVELGEVKKVLIHQANAKMDEAILARLFKAGGIDEMPAGIMPMTISWLGNSSVATLPTLFDLMRRGNLESQSFSPGDVVVFASVGAGMNINSMVYRVP